MGHTVINVTGGDTLMNFYSPMHSTGPDATEVPLLRLPADDTVPVRAFGLYEWGTPDHAVESGPLDSALTALASLAGAGVETGNADDGPPGPPLAPASRWPSVPSDISGLGL
ncbi:MAG TPA: hypothetical protein VES01_10865 [Dermatophilaceae bacterium]|nr:hypothetical protein [Dermatophilaceae bacterium]